MGASLDLFFCIKCGFLFIRAAGRAKMGWTHHDGRHIANTPLWCSCRVREPVPRNLRDAILGADQVGGRGAAQYLLDQTRGVKPEPVRSPDRIQVSRRNYPPLSARYDGIDRGVAPASAFAQLYGHKGSMLVVDDPMATTVLEPTDENREKILAWFAKALPRTGGT